MAERPIEYYLKKLEEYRKEDLDFPRPAMASELGIPFETYRNWYRGTEKRSDPSSKYAKCIKSFLESREIISARRWIEEDGPGLLNRIGVEKGQTVMDFGSGNGDYVNVKAKMDNYRAGKVHRDRASLSSVLCKIPHCRRHRYFSTLSPKWIES
jgi:hypothetical protein